MAKLSLVQTFATLVSSQIPDPEKVGVFKKYDFTMSFKLFPQTEDSRAELQKLNEEKGNYGFLNHVLHRVVEKPKEIELVDENDIEMSAEEWVKQHLIVQSDAVMAFWEVIGRGVEAKNSKKSRTR